MNESINQTLEPDDSDQHRHFDPNHLSFFLRRRRSSRFLPCHHYRRGRGHLFFDFYRLANRALVDPGPGAVAHRHCVAR